MNETQRIIFTQGIIFILQLFFMLLAARLLGPSSQGKYAIIRTSVYLAETIMWFGLTSGVTYFIAKDFKKYHNIVLNVAFVYLLLMVLISLVTFNYFLPYLNIPQKTGYLSVVWVGALALVQIFQKIFLGQKRYRLYNFVYLINALASFFILFIFWFLGQVTLDSIVACNIFAMLSSLLCALYFHKGYLKKMKVSLKIKCDILKDLYRIGLRGYLSSIAFLIMYRIDFFFVGYFLGGETLGIYTIAVFIIEAIQKIPDWLGLILPPKVTAGLDKAGKLTRKYARVSLVYCLIISAFIYLFYALDYEYTVLALGDKYQGVEKIVMLLTPRALLHSVMVIFAANLSGKGYTIYHPLAGIVSLLVLVIIDASFIPAYGINAAIVGITAAYVFASITMMVGYKKFVNKDALLQGVS